jgi:hypothetical protein
MNKTLRTKRVFDKFANFDHSDYSRVCLVNDQ